MGRLVSTKAKVLITAFAISSPYKPHGTNL